MNKAAYERLPRDLKTVIDNNAGQATAAMAGVMWDVEARAVAETARGRGDPITVLTADEGAPWRKAAEPVIAAWQKQMKERKLDGGKLIAAVRESGSEIRRRTRTAARAIAASFAVPGTESRDRTPAVATASASEDRSFHEA